MNLRNALGAPNPAPAASLLVRMGVNLGPAKLLKDINGQLNVIGDGINVAQRVMTFAEPSQILVSRSFYEVISCLSPEYARLFQYCGLRKDKHVREHAVYEVRRALQEGTVAKPPVEDEQASLENEEGDEDLWLAQVPVRWDRTMLQHLQRHLTYHVGPVAKLLVSQAAKRATELGAFCEMLAAHIPEAGERAFFLRQVAPFLRSQASQSTSHPPSPVAISWEPSGLKRLEDHLGQYLGPVARLLVRREVKEARDFAHLCQLLARHIPREEERSSFLRDVTTH
jgi:hypothetical protein